MATTFNWIVEWMLCYPQAEGHTDVVFQVGWRCNGVDGEYTGTVYSTCGVTYKAGEPYTPYANLTQDQVLGWCWASGVDKTATEAAIQNQIDGQINPPIVQPPLPWATPAA